MPNVGDIVYFRATKPIRCRECHSETESLRYSVATGQVRTKQVTYTGEWPRVKDCDCVGDCLCAGRIDYSATPTITEHSACGVVVDDPEEGEISLFPINEVALTTDREVAERWLAEGIGLAVLIRHREPLPL